MTIRSDLGLDPRRPVFQGDTVALATTVVNDDFGTPQNLTGATATYAVFDLDPDTGAAVSEQFRKTVGSGITLTDSAAGLMTIIILGSNTQSLVGAHYHELEVTIGSTVQTAFFGTIHFRIDGIT